MKSTGIVRKINGLGKIVLPVGVRRMLGIEIGDGVEIYADGGDVILRKHVPGCVLCGEGHDTIDYMGVCVCRKCVADVADAAATAKGGCAV